MSDHKETSREFSRRKFIGALAGLSGAAIAGAGVGININTTKANALSSLSSKTIPFFGEHQSGILNTPPANAIICVFDLTTTSYQTLSELLQIMTVEIEKLTQGVAYKDNDRTYPSRENLLNGDPTLSDELTITVGLGASVFDERFGLKNKKPAQLKEMPSFPNDNLGADRTHGDIILQICAQHNESCIRALRILAKATNDKLKFRWLEQGFIQTNLLSAGKTSTRNLLGFKDGTSNPDTQDINLMDEIIWVDKNANEPDWTIGGSYMVVRTIRLFVEHWDNASLEKQESIFGRYKSTGAPLGRNKEDDIPIYHKNPTKNQISLDSHIALANPRTKDSEKNLILRRSYNYSRSVDDQGLLDQGMIFICFQKSLQDGFLAIQNRLNGEMLEEYNTPVGGGFFYALPGVEKGSFLGEKLFL